MRRSDLAVLGLWFTATRLAAALGGVEPNPLMPGLLWQLLPMELLRDRPAESLWYLHSQPPLFNAFVALLLKLPGDYLVYWRWCWIGIGFFIVVATWSCVRLAGAPRAAAHAFTFVVAMNPTLLLYENLFLYSYVEAAGVLAVLWALLATGQWRWAIVALWMCVLVGVRPLFHPLWVCGVAVAVVTSCHGRVDWRMLLGLGVPLLLAAALVGKNVALFNVWSTSSWYGHNFAKLSRVAARHDLHRLHESGAISRLMLIGPFKDVQSYPDLTARAVERTKERFGDVPALTMAAKDNGLSNFNHAVYVDTSRQLMADSRNAIEANRVSFIKTVLQGFTAFHAPASGYFFLDDNRQHLAWLEQIYRSAIYPADTLIFVRLALFATALSLMAVWLYPVGRWRPLGAAAGFLFVTVVWVTVSSNLAEFGENARFRFTLDPAMITWLAVVISRLIWPPRASSGGDCQRRHAIDKPSSAQLSSAGPLIG